MSAQASRIAFVYPALALKGGAENLLVWLMLALQERGYEIELFTGTVRRDLWPSTLWDQVTVRPLTPPIYRWGVNHSKTHARYINGRYLARALEGFDAICPWNGKAMQYVHLAKSRNPRLGRALFLCHEPTRRWFPHDTDTRLHHDASGANGYGESYDNLHVARDAREFQTRTQRHQRKLLRNARWEREATASASVIVANSRFSAEHIKSAFGRQARVVYPGIPSNGAADPAPPPKDDPPYIGCAGHLSVRKNVHNVIRAFAGLRQAGALARHVLRIAGTGPERHLLEQLARESGVGDAVQFLGLIPDAELGRFYDGADAIVYAPIDEPFGLVPLEAAAHGVPVIVPDQGGPCEVFVAGEHALMVNPFNPTAIGTAIRSCIEDIDATAQRVAKARKLVATQYHVDRYASDISAIIAAS